MSVPIITGVDIVTAARLQQEEIDRLEKLAASQNGGIQKVADQAGKIVKTAEKGMKIKNEVHQLSANQIGVMAICVAAAGLFYFAGLTPFK